MKPYIIGMKLRCAAWIKSHKAPAILLSVCLLAPTSGASTQVITICYPDKIVIAADSRNVDSNWMPLPTNVCKIHQAGQFWWSAAGYNMNSFTGFSVDRFFSGPITAYSDIRNLLDAVGSRIRDPLQVAVINFRSRHPDQFKKITRDGTDNTFLTLFAAKFSGNQPEESMKEFKLVNDRIVPQPTTSYDPSSRRTSLNMTTRLAVNRYVIAHPDVWYDTPENFVDRLMNVAIADDPVTVGLPVSILLITKDGPKWLRQNNCETIKP